MQNELWENRISINELLSEVRAQGIGDISEVQYAILEQNGSLSLLKKSDGNLGHTVIIDGSRISEVITRLGYDERWLEGRLRDEGCKTEDVFLMTVSDNGDINIILKEEK